ncbi:28 kDa ribonucleoprotein, chloroplastic [Vigna radiata var. radiata]|uniref:28 kDa ribonucleoprotein, chloroplastic n=1 Tax=Vigna radiata var. radiata TaxID=3916 RepID=A0A1S3V9N0_VIGRR|nr:28 kDa ribonucleoprotein, chloroplastic [Vigna radiata var. radiata]
MAATAAGIASLFSSSINNIKCLRSKHCSMMDPLMTAMPSNRMSHLVEPLSIGGTMSHRLWWPRISAAVAQEELVAADDAGFVEEENEGEVVAEQDSDESFADTKLYFGNLPYSVDSAKLAGLIQDYGSAELIEVLYDRDTGKSRGFAFVTMSCIEDCNTVIENLDGKEFMGRTLRVNFSNKPKPKEPLYPETEHKLFVGNLSWSVTNEILTQAFQEYGTVVGARVLYDGETGRSRGYGFVCFSTKAEMESALEALNDVELEGRAMRVSLAQGKRAQG